MELLDDDDSDWLGLSTALADVSWLRTEAAAWRCIDASHAAECAACSPPPAASELPAFALVGEGRKGAGEKRLRSSVSATPEWHSPGARAALALAADAAQLKACAAALRSKRAAALRKADLAFVLAAWRYRTDAFVPKHALRRSRPRAPPPTAAAPAETALAEAAAAVAVQLRPLSAAAVRAAAGEAARAAAEAALPDRSHVTPAALAEVRALAAAVRHIPAALAGMHTTLLLQASALASSSSVTIQAPACDEGAMLAPLRAFLDAGGARVRELAATAARDARDACESSDEVARACLVELAEGHAASARLFDACGAMLARGCAAGAGPGVALLLLEALLVHVATSHAAFARREAWMQRVLARNGGCGHSGGDGPGTPPLVVCGELPPALAQLAAGDGSCA